VILLEVSMRMLSDRREIFGIRSLVFFSTHVYSYSTHDINGNGGESMDRMDSSPDHEESKAENRNMGILRIGRGALLPVPSWAILNMDDGCLRIPDVVWGSQDG
jgi:hypothetical protein